MSQINILIVEDDLNISKMLEVTLSIVGYKSKVCHDGKEAVEQVLRNTYDLVLLDVMLPGMDGFDIIQRIRHRAPVIFLTAMQDVSDKVRGLRLGAEDYIVKPFEAVELLARIEVVLRRSNKGESQLHYENILVDLDRHPVFLDNREVQLTPKEFDVLSFFIKNQDIALTRERLLAAVWGYEYEGREPHSGYSCAAGTKEDGIEGEVDYNSQTGISP